MNLDVTGIFFAYVQAGPIYLNFKGIFFNPDDIVKDIK